MGSRPIQGNATERSKDKWVGEGRAGDGSAVPGVTTAIILRMNIYPRIGIVLYCHDSVERKPNDRTSVKTSVVVVFVVWCFSASAYFTEESTFNRFLSGENVLQANARR